MNINVKVIRFTSFCSVVFALLTYLVSINISHEWIECLWLPSNFILTVIGGAFASMLVVLVCEIQKYFQNRKSAEITVFNYMGLIYKELVSAKSNLYKLRQSKDQIVSKDVLSQNAFSIQNAINVLCNLDYSTFCKSNTKYGKYIELRAWLLGVLTIFINSFIYLQLAINYDQMNGLKCNGFEGNITYNGSFYTRLTIDKYLDQIDAYIDNIETYISSVYTDSCEQTEWSRIKGIIIDSCNIEAKNLESFLELNTNNDYEGCTSK